MEHDESADALEAEADDMQQGSKQLGDRIESARSDWQAKQSDESVPGAIDPDAGRPGGGEAEADDESDSEEDSSTDGDDSAADAGDEARDSSSRGQAEADDESSADGNGADSDDSSDDDHDR